MTKIKFVFFQIAIVYLLNYVWLENQLPAIEKLSLINLIALMMLVFLFFSLHQIFQIRQSATEINTLFFFLLTVVFGLLGFLIFKLQSATVTLTDTFLFSRFFIAFLFTKYLFTKREQEEIWDWVKLNLKIILIFNFVCLILNQMFSVFPVLDIRFGIASQMLLYPHPTYLGTISFLGLICLEEDENSTLYQVLGTLLVISTLRNKVIILMLFVFGIRIILKKKQRLYGERFFFLAFLGILLIILFKDTIFIRLLDQESSARSVLLNNAIDLMLTYFPFGLGFGTYGSYMSFANYSQIYISLGINRIYGFLPTSYQYGMDSYISMLLAQFGFLGTLSFSAMLFNLAKSTLFVEKKLERTRAFILVFIICSSVTESVISTGLGMLLFIIMVIANKEENIFPENKLKNSY